MDLDQLNYFIKVAKHESISNAAEELNVSQPYLSRMISLLENEVGVKLFDRRNRRIFLNEYGKTFLDSADSVLNILDKGIHNIKNLSKVYYGTINIGIFAFAKVFTDCLSNYSKLNPFVRFKLMSTVGLNVRNGVFDYDVFIYSQSIRHPNIVSIPILKEKFVVMMSKNHPLSAKKSIDLLELKNERFVFTHATSFYLDFAFELCQRAGFIPHLCYETDNDIVKLDLVDSGEAVAIVPEICTKSFQALNPDIVFLQIEKIECGRTIYLGWRNDNHANPLALSFKNFAIEYYKHTKPYSDYIPE